MSIDPHINDMATEEHAIRASRGLSPRVLDSSLMAMAQGWAEECATAGRLLRHARFASRASRFGASGIVMAENEASGYANASAAYRGWMNSAGHRANILDRDTNVAGFGHAVSAEGNYYWAADYGTRADAPSNDQPPPTSNIPQKRKGWLARVLGLFGISLWLLVVLAIGQDLRPDDAQRSPKWPAVRAKHLAANPSCAACGTARKAILSVHHIVPFHVDRSKELDTANLITLCEGQGVNCHLLFGHLMNWSSWNVNVREDAAAWRAKIRNRPKLVKAKVAA